MLTLRVFPVFSEIFKNNSVECHVFLMFAAILNSLCYNMIPLRKSSFSEKTIVSVAEWNSEPMRRSPEPKLYLCCWWRCLPWLFILLLCSLAKRSVAEKHDYTLESSPWYYSAFSPLWNFHHCSLIWNLEIILKCTDTFCSIIRLG